MSIRNTSSLTNVSTRWSGHQEDGGGGVVCLNDTEWRRESSTVLYRQRDGWRESASANERERERESERERERERGRKASTQILSLFMSSVGQPFLCLWPLGPTACHYNTQSFPKSHLGQGFMLLEHIYKPLLVFSCGQAPAHLTLAKLEPLFLISSW